MPIKMAYFLKTFPFLKMVVIVTLFTIKEIETFSCILKIFDSLFNFCYLEIRVTSLENPFSLKVIDQTESFTRINYITFIHIPSTFGAI